MKAILHTFFKPVGFAGGKILPNGDLQIPKKEITASAKFYPYKLDSVLIEVLALRAPDGTADANNITIAKSLFVEAKPIFLNWKTR